MVDEQVPAGSVARALREAGGDLLESVDLFDVYRGASVDDGSRSLAFRLRFCAPDRTLTDDEVGDLRTRCVEAVAQPPWRARLPLAGASPGRGTLGRGGTVSSLHINAVW